MAHTHTAAVYNVYNTACEVTQKLYFTLQMLQYLQQFSQQMVSRTHEISEQVNSLMHEVKVSVIYAYVPGYVIPRGENPFYSVCLFFMTAKIRSQILKLNKVLLGPT